MIQTSRTVYSELISTKRITRQNCDDILNTLGLLVETLKEPISIKLEALEKQSKLLIFQK